jgi:hypothetical protein
VQFRRLGHSGLEVSTIRLGTWDGPASPARDGGRPSAQHWLNLLDLRVGCASATWMGGTWQTCRELIDADVLGRPVGANRIWLDRGYETWHPRSRSYYQPGVGPTFDIGPYYIAALVPLFGAVLDVLDGLVSSALDGSARRMRSKPGRPDPLQLGISRNGQLTSGADRGGGGVRTVIRGDES